MGPMPRDGPCCGVNPALQAAPPQTKITTLSGQTTQKKSERETFIQECWLHQLLIPSTPSTAPRPANRPPASRMRPRCSVQRPARPLVRCPWARRPNSPKGLAEGPGATAGRLRVSASGGRKNGGETTPPGFDTSRSPNKEAEKRRGALLPEKNIAPGTSASTSFFCTWRRNMGADTGGNSPKRR